MLLILYETVANPNPPQSNLSPKEARRLLYPLTVTDYTSLILSTKLLTKLHLCNSTETICVPLNKQCKAVF